MIYDKNYDIINSSNIPELLDVISTTESSTTISDLFNELKTLFLTSNENKDLSCKKLIQFQKEIKRSVDLMGIESISSLFSKVNKEITCQLHVLFNNILQTLNDQSTKNNEGKIKKYNELKKIIRLVKETSDTDEPELSLERKVFIKKIGEMLKDIKSEYQTNSHWFIATQKNFHLKEIQPELKQKPSDTQLKIDFSDINKTLKLIRDKKCITRVRALMYIAEKIQEKISSSDSLDEIKTLENSLKQVMKFIDRLPLEEQILAIKMINSIDKNVVQERNLSELYDKVGKKFATYFLRREVGSVNLLVSYLVTILRDRFRVDPSLSCVEMIREWPIRFDNDLKMNKIYTIDYRIKLIDQLFELSKQNAMENPLKNLVFEYLFNLLDPIGELRKKHVVESLNSEKMEESQRSIKRNYSMAQLVNSLCWFGANEEIFLPQV